MLVQFAGKVDDIEGIAAAEANNNNNEHNKNKNSYDNEGLEVDGKEISKSMDILGMNKVSLLILTVFFSRINHSFIFSVFFAML